MAFWSGTQGLIVQTDVKRLIIVGLDQYKEILLGIGFSRDKHEQGVQDISQH
jgi:hypothetical protein